MERNTQRLIINSLLLLPVLIWADPAPAFGCGTPIHLVERSTGTLIEFVVPFSVQVPTGQCIQSNIGCNGHDVLLSVSAANLIFRKPDVFCASKDREDLKREFVNQHRQLLALFFILVIGGVIGWKLRGARERRLRQKSL